MEKLVPKIKKAVIDRKAIAGVIGLGYVGLPLAMTMVKNGFKVFGFDLDHKKISMIHAKKSYISHIKDDVIKAAKNLNATSDFKKLKECDFIVICVPTPTTKTNQPDLSYIINTGKEIAKHMRKGQTIVLESTTYPTTTRDVLKPELDKSGLVCGKDYYLAFSPEREDPGNKNFNTETITKVVGGFDKNATELASLFYRQFIKKICVVSSCEVAESTKMLENSFRAVNIAFINELKMLFDRMGIDIWEVIEASKTKPFGYMPFYPGPGWGGHCIPVDPFYLSWIAKEYDFTAHFIELAGETNIKMPEYVIEKIDHALNKIKKSINGAKILILGAAYKKDIGDPRESPSFRIMELLLEQKAKLSYNDPFIPELPKMRKFNIQLKSVPVNEKTLKTFDCVVVITDHSAYDFEFILKHCRYTQRLQNCFK
jgi:UDP-N-acetyl-D-glucosamine dehydrogenase